MYTCSVIVEYERRKKCRIAGLSMFTCLVYFVKLTFNSCLFALIRKLSFFIPEPCILLLLMMKTCRVKC